LVLSTQANGSGHVTAGTVSASGDAVRVHASALAAVGLQPVYHGTVLVELDRVPEFWRQPVINCV
jgi:hypothetical protein